MKKIISFLSIMFFVLGLRGVDESILNLCHEIEQIDPKASQEQFTKLAKKIKDSGLSTLVCIKTLNEKRIEAAQQTIEKDFKISKKQLAEMGQFIEEITKEDRNEGGVASLDFMLIPDDLETSDKPQGLAQEISYFPNETGFLIKLLVQAGYCNNKVIVTRYRPFEYASLPPLFNGGGNTKTEFFISNPTGITQEKEDRYDQVADCLRFEKLRLLKCNGIAVNIGIEYDSVLNEQGRKGLLIRTILGSALQRNSWKKGLLLKYFLNKIDQLVPQKENEKYFRNANGEMDVSTEMSSITLCRSLDDRNRDELIAKLYKSSWINYLRALENSADQCPAAMSLENALLIECYFQQLWDAVTLIKSNEKQARDKFTSKLSFLGSSFEALEYVLFKKGAYNLGDPYVGYDDLSARLAMATRIRKLKEAEKFLAKGAPAGQA